MGVVAAVLAAAWPSQTVLLAGGIDPEDASPGLGAFLTFLILALVIIALAWSFTRHQRKIRARERLEVDREEALAEQAEGAQAENSTQPGGAADAPGEPASGDEPPALGDSHAPRDSHAPAGPEAPSESDQNGTQQP